MSWKKFEGTVESFPVFVKTIDNGLWTISSKEGLDHAIQTCGEFFIDYYMTVPEMPRG